LQSAKVETPVKIFQGVERLFVRKETGNKTRFNIGEALVYKDNPFSHVFKNDVPDDLKVRVS